LENHIQGKIISSAWFNKNIVVGSLSFFPTGNNAEDSIDFTIQVDANINIFLSDVCTSSGKIIYTIEEQNIDLGIGNESISLLLYLAKKSGKNFIDWFKQQNWQNIDLQE